MSSRVIPAVFLLAFPMLLGCGGTSAERDPGASAATSTPASAPDRETSRAATPGLERPPASATPQIIFLGDSLTAGLGLDADLSFPALIQKRLEQDGYAYRVVNAGVSGDTSAGGLRRLEWAMAEGKPHVLIVALGGNDGLRGLPPEQLEKNLATIIERGQARGATVILAGMEAPPNFGADYTSRFRAVYPSLASKYNVKLIPFILQGVAGDPALNQSDGIHPNRRGAQVIADMVWRTLEPELTRASSDK